MRAISRKHGHCHFIGCLKQWCSLCDGFTVVFFGVGIIMIEKYVSFTHGTLPSIVQQPWIDALHVIG
jgi:hypothetical protein